MYQPLKQLPETLLGDGDGEVAAVEDLHLGHGVLVRLLLGVRPVHDDITAPHLDPPRPQPPGHKLVTYHKKLDISTDNQPLGEAGGFM